MRRKTTTRREFLALMGAGAGSIVAAVCGAASVGVYWLLSEDEASVSGLPITTTPDATRLAILKTVNRPPIVSREDWGARAIDHSAEDEFGFYTLDNPEGWREYEGDLRDVYQTVIIHHSVTYDVDDPSTMLSIQALHMDTRHWADIGYHFCVGKSGTVFEGRRLSARGAHTELYNTGSLGICLLGNFEEEIPTEVQLSATQMLVNWLALRLRATHLAGHRDFNDQTRCPGASLYPYLDAMAQEALLKRGTDGYIPPQEQQITPEAVSGSNCCCCV